jgi:RNA-binding protein
MTMRGKDRASLRAEANRLPATVHVGHAGITPALIQSLEDALRARELVKVQLSKRSDRTPKTLATELAAATGAEVVQVIGRTATFYRHNPDLERKDDAPPPWR